MHHSSAQNFDPACFFTDVAATAAAFEAGNIHFHRWLREWEEAWAKTDFAVVAEHFLGEDGKCPFQVAHADIFSDDQSFYLRELVRMRRIIAVATIHFARADDFSRFSAFGFHRTRLYR